MSNKKVIGIDLGTGNSCVAVIENNKANVIANAEGNRTTPSVVYISGTERKIGSSAKRGMIMKPKNTVSFIKRFMGADWNDADVQRMLKSVTYDVVNKNGKPYVKIDDKEYSPEEISSFILTEMKKTAEDYYGCEVKDAVITCPAWYNNTQREAVKLAGELAGLNVLRVINEPTAAILSSSANVNSNETKVVLVNDFGSGTQDVSVCEVSEGMIEVLASYGDVFLGGTDIDNAIVDWLADEYKKDHSGVDLKKDSMALARLVEAAEKAKCELSTTTETEINLPYISVQDGVPQMLITKLNRAKFEQLITPIVDKVIDCAVKALEKSGKSKSDLNEILLVGGSSRIPLVQKRLEETFGIKPSKNANFDEAVALGAATQANVAAGNAGEDATLLLDVTPISLGIETNGANMTKMVEANTTIPVTKKQIFTTAVDNQPAVSIVVLQGERPMAADNKVIGTFNLDGITPAPRGIPQIEVEFTIDVNGILSVKAVDKATNKEQHITIDNSNSLTKEEIERIKKDAADHAEEDKKREEELKKMNEAEAYKYGVENALKDETISAKFTDDEKTQLEDLSKKLDEALQTKDLSQITPAKEALEKVFAPIISKIYQEQQAANGQQAQPDFSQMFNKAGQQAQQGTATTNADAEVEEVQAEEVE